MNYEHMKVFYTVAKNENLSKAALELGLTQPAVSRTIATIEKTLKVKLFIRSKNGVKLTREGLNFFEMIKNPLNELEKVEISAKNTSGLKNLTIHIGATTIALYCYLFKELEELKKEFKDINFRIYTGSSTKLLEMVKNNSIDLAFITTPYLETDEVELEHIYELNDILVAPYSLKNELSKKVSIKDLTSYPFVLLNNSMQYREFIDSFLVSYGLKINPTYEVDSSSIILPLVEANGGLAFIPEAMANNSLSLNKIFKVNLKEKLPKRYISFAFKKTSNHASAIYEIRNYILKSKI